MKMTDVRAIAASTVLVLLALAVILISGSANAGWVYETSVDEFTDEVSHTVSSTGNDNDWIIAVGCTEQMPLEVGLVNFSHTPIPKISVMVWIKYRFDDEKTVDTLGIWAQDSEALIVTLLDSDAISFIERLVEHNQLIVRVGAEETARFNLKGSRAAIERVLPHCGDYPTPYRSDAPSSMSEIDNIRSQIEKNWNVLVGARGAESMIVTLHIKLRSDGTVTSVEVAEDDRHRMREDRFFRSMAESAVRAVNRTRQIKYLSPETYHLWRDITVTFDSREMFDYPSR